MCGRWIAFNQYTCTFISNINYGTPGLSYMEIKYYIEYFSHFLLYEVFLEHIIR